MPFMQVGTSCTSAVSRGIDYTFTWKERFENIAFAVLAFATRQIPGPAFYETFRFHPGISTPESLRGSSADDLTLGITHDAPARHREGFTDLSRSFGWDCSRHGQCDLPDKEFRYLRTVHSVTAHRSMGARSFLSRSALSPGRSDYLIPFPLQRVRHIVSEDSGTC
jgi:hypothetical protein